MNIQKFIKHCESKGYKLISSDKFKTLLNFSNEHLDNEIGKYITLKKEVFNIERCNFYEDTSETVYKGKIESLEQFDLIDRLTS